MVMERSQQICQAITDLLILVLVLYLLIGNHILRTPAPTEMSEAGDGMCVADPPRLG